MNNEYKIGDIVRVIGIQKSGKFCVSWSSSMNKYIGNEFAIHYISENRRWCNLDGAREGLVNGNGYWKFDFEWLEPATNNLIDINSDDIDNIFEMQCAVK